MKKVILCFSIISTILFNGCFNYRDIDKIIYVTTVIVDMDGSKNPILYIEAFKPSRGGQGSSGKGERVIFQGTGKTIFEIVRDVGLSSSYKLNYTQNRGVIFTQKAAEEGLDNFIDFFYRDQETVVRADIAICKGDPQKLLNAKLKEQEYIGLFIHDLIYNISSSSRGVILSINDFLNRSYSANRTVVITTIDMKKDQLEDKVEVSDVAILKDFKLVGMLDRRQSEGYNFLIDNIRGGTLEVPNPDVDGKFISLEILKSKTNTKVSYDGKKIHVKKTINTKASISEIQKSFYLTKENLGRVEKKAESNIYKECMRIFENYKQKDLDIFEITDEFQRRYPREKVEDVISNSDLELEVHVTIEGSSDTIGFRPGGK